jgi:acyl-coenzyme A synthetase/AMP-(fatty) acid ligase
VLAKIGARPRVIVVAPDALPRTTSGKLGRRRCAALVHD